MTGRTPRVTRARLPSDLVVHLARFAEELRRCDVAVGLKDEIDAARALVF